MIDATAKADAPAPVVPLFPAQEAPPDVPLARLLNRISSLPLTRYCGLAARLGAEHGAGMAALMSRCWHAMLAGNEAEARRLHLALDTQEKLEVASWKRPTDVQLDGLTLRYADAEKELRVGLDRNGSYCDPEDPACLTIGTLDFAWCVELNGQRLAVVADLKKSEFTTVDGPDTIQLRAYAFAYASKVGADAFMVGLFIGETGVWDWNPEVVDVCSKRAAELWAEVRQAAENTTGEPVTGAHCRSCYSRLHCPEWVLPATVVGTELEPLVTGSIDSDSALRLLRFVEALSGDGGLLERAKDTLKTYVNQGGVIQDPVTGKVWRPVTQKGRPSVSVESLRDQLGEEVAAKFITRGAPFQRFTWTKP